MTTDQILVPAGSTLPDDDQLIDLVRDVWSSFLGLDGEELLEVPGGDAAGGWATGTVSVSGEWSGHVAASLSPALAVTAAAGMLMADEVSEDDVSDALGELANIVGGTVKSLVPGPSTLSLPQVLLEGPLPHFPGCHETRRLEISFRGEPLRLAIWVAAHHPQGEPS